MGIFCVWRVMSQCPRFDKSSSLKCLHILDMSGSGSNNSSTDFLNMNLSAPRGANYTWPNAVNNAVPVMSNENFEKSKLRSITNSPPKNYTGPDPFREPNAARAQVPVRPFNPTNPFNPTAANQNSATNMSTGNNPFNVFNKKGGYRRRRTLQSRRRRTQQSRRRRTQQSRRRR